MKTRHIAVRFVAGGMLCLAAPAVLSAQYYSTLVGTVRDPAGAAMANTRVAATEMATGVVTETMTNERGDYRITTLRPGAYTVAARRDGFKESVVAGIVSSVGQTTRVDLVLELGTITEDVVVAGAAPLIQTETAERGVVLASLEVEALPLNTRSIGELAYLVPGAVQSSSGFQALPSVNGLGGAANQFYVDGTGLTSSYMMAPVERITIDSIEEFKVETANTTASHGLLAGSTISIATKHGTNELHGTAYEFVRNDALNARSFFAQTVPDLRYNNFGANLGGPILKNKLFFFVNYEGSREHRGRTVTATVPTMAERQGDFTPGTGARDAPIFDPFDVDPATNMRRPFPNNKIPESRWNPIAMRYLALWPEPNTPGFPNYRLNVTSKNDYDKYAARIDYNLSDRDSLLFRIGHQSNPTTNPGPIPGGGTGTAGNLLEGRHLGATWNHVFGGRALNQARFSYAKLLQSDSDADYAGQNLAKEFGFENGDRIQPGIWGLPGIRLSGVPTRGLGGAQIWTFPNRTYYFSNDFSLTLGAHSFKTGVLHQRYGIDTVYGNSGGVISNFDGRLTSATGDLSGQPFADFLLGALRAVSVNENPQISPDRRNIWQMYIQDDWRASSELTLQLGLRYDMNLPGFLADGRAGAWLEGLDRRTGQELILPANGRDALQEVLKGEELGFPHSFSDRNWLSKPQWTNFGPRLGAAYRPFGDTKTAIRGGFGIYYNMIIGTIQNNRNWGRPFQSFASTPARPTTFEPPPYQLGDAPVISPFFQPGELFRSGYVASPDWPDLRVAQWNLTFDRDLGHDFAVEVGYVGNRTTRGMNVSTWNRTYPVGYTFDYDDGSTFTIEPDTPLLQRKKYPQLDTGTSSWPWSHSNYHSLQVQAVKRMSNGVQFRVGYTRSRLRGQNGIFQDEWNLDGLSYYLANDVPNVFFATYVVQLPGQRLRGLPGAVLGGWQLAGIVNLHSGGRVTVYESQPQFANASEVFPILVGDPNLPSSERTLDRWFNTDAFRQPGPNEFGSNASINSIRTDSLQNFDLVLSKSFNVREDHRVQIRGEFFNLFNHPTFGPPNATRGSAGFGRVTSAGRAREVQLGIKYQF